MGNQTGTQKAEEIIWFQAVLLDMGQALFA